MITYSHLGKLGRFGNQLFQIAACIGCSQKYNQDFFLTSHWEYQKYFQSSLPYLIPFSNKVPVYREPFFYYSDIPKKNDIDLYGYFQSEKYFIHCRDLIRHYFTPIKKYEKSNYISVHIRRGDYLASGGYHPVLPVDYYLQAMELFTHSLFMVFSDDINWCKENFKRDNVFFYSGENEVEDFFVASSCKHHIIANSSFSWWYSWLGSQAGKKVIAPKEWFGRQANKITKDLYCENWIVI